MEEEKPKEKQFRKIGIKISSWNLKSLLKVTDEMARVAKGMGLRFWGPTYFFGELVVVETKGCGKFKLRIHVRLFDILGSTEVVQQIISDSNDIDHDVNVVEIKIRCAQKSMSRGELEQVGVNSAATGGSV